MREPLRLTAAVVLAGLVSVAATTLAPGAEAAPIAGAPVPDGLRVDAAARVLHHGAATTPIPLGATEMPDPREVRVEAVSLGGGREIVHVRVPSRLRAGVAWEALVAGPTVVFAGVTGYATGQDGERTGQAVQIVASGPAEGGASHVLVGDVREDLRICGQAETLLAPRALDPQSMTLRGASVQRLPREQRDKAIKLDASPRGGPAEAPLAPLLAVSGASTEKGPARALTDGDAATAWSEGRPGDGRGELVVMRAPAEVPITRFAVVVAPKGATAVQLAEGAAPRSFFLVTDAQTFAVTLPEDAWAHPGAAYDVPLPEPLRASCLTLVLDDASARGLARPDVTVAELYAYSAFDGPSATLGDVVAALNGGGPRAEAAAAVLKRAGAEGLAAAAGTYGKLDDRGRALALDVAASAPSCGTSAPLLLAALGDRDREVARKGREKLERCGKSAIPALVAAVGGEDEAARRSAAPLLAAIAPGAAVDALASAMGAGGPETRAAVRSAFARAARGATKEKMETLVGDASRSTEARIDLLRASSATLPAIHATASRAVDELLAPGAAPSMRTRYLLAAPLAELARGGDEGALARLGALATRDADPSVRAHAAEAMHGVPGAEPALALAIRDPEPRVREAALHGLLGTTGSTAIAAATARLAEDDWTFVRAAAAATLAALPASPATDGPLTAALRDRTARVREAAVEALAAHGARASSRAIRARMDDEREELEVRVSAARALGTLCDASSIDALTELAGVASVPIATEAELQVGLAATDALGKLHPADLAKRLASLRDKSARAEVQRAAERALASPPLCR